MIKEGKKALAVIVTGFAVWLAMVSVMLFLVGSLVTSSVKAVSGQCGKSFGVPVVSQDWFCAK